jgi:hypothetical protein
MVSFSGARLEMDNPDDGNGLVIVSFEWQQG